MAVVYLRFDVNENYFKFVVNLELWKGTELTFSLCPAGRLLFVERQETLCKGYLFDLLTSK